MQKENGLAIGWIDMRDEHPPLGEYVLTYCGGHGWPCVETDMLDFGSGQKPTSDASLLYWNSGNDFGEVTHWAPMPPLPEVPLNGYSGQVD